MNNHPLGSEPSEEQWMSVADMMAGLMMIFMFLAIIYSQRFSDSYNNIEEAQKYAKLICQDLESLLEEDNNYLKDITVCENGILITFDADDKFATGDIELSDNFKAELNDFIPRFMCVIERHINKISELRIEGHTDSTYKNIADERSRYLKNVTLSQGRAESVMNYFFNQLHNPNSGYGADNNNQCNFQWSHNYVTAHGLSFSQLKRDENGIENKSKSRRVEFRLVTKAEKRLLKELANITNNL